LASIPFPATARIVLTARGLRAFADGYVAVLLPAYLLELGFGQLEVGFLSTTTLLGSAIATLAVGGVGNRWPRRTLLSLAAALMFATGIGFAGSSHWWPLLVVAFFGTLNPSSGDVSLFLPLEHAQIAHTAGGQARTALFARYTFTGAMAVAAGALAAGIPALLVSHFDISPRSSLRAMFLLYALIGAVVWLLYRRLPPSGQDEAAPAAPLGPSRGIVARLAMLFSVDAFAGGLVIQSLLALWLFQRFGISLAAAANFFFCSNLLAAASQYAAPVVACRIGLLNTMVFTHIPASVCLILAAFAPDLHWALGLLFVRSALSQMDVPTRSAYVMAVVTPAERAAAASFTAVPRSLASAASPTLGGALFALGMMSAPLVACGVLKIAYDLALFVAFRKQGMDGS